MRLDEILNRALPYDVTRNTSKTFIASFKAGGRTIQFQADYEDEGNWVIGFGEERKRGADDGFDLDYGKTGGGKEFDVFGTLRAILDHFIKERRPVGIRFTADHADGNRASLYARMFKKKLPAGWELDIQADDGADGLADPMTFFMMTRK